MTQPVFTLIVAASADGFIARHSRHNPSDWASSEEQAHFLSEVDSADWGIMGRGTHEMADKPHRRRIVFSSAFAVPQWRRTEQLWLDPAEVSPADLPALVASRRPLRSGLILGATRVHDWFLAHGVISRIMLTVEPVSFGAGLPIFSEHQGNTPEAALMSAGFACADERVLNAGGSRLLTFLPEGSA